MRQKYLLIFSAGILFFLLAIFILISIFSHPSITNKPIPTDYNRFQPIKTTPPPNGAIEDVTPTKKNANVSPFQPISTSFNKFQRVSTNTPTPTAKIIPLPTSGSLSQGYIEFENPTITQTINSQYPISNIQNNEFQRISTSFNEFQYYSQCGTDYKNYTLPQGCTMCESGCGLTTVAMVLSSYLGIVYTPINVASIYKENGFYAGCSGTKVTDAQTVLNQKGLETTDFLMLTPMGKDEAIAEMKKYIDAGWTIFTMGRYCAGGCAHFFWITKIDSDNKVWSYDPFYNKDIAPPLDVSHYDPYPEYRIAFGVKK